MRVVAAIRGVFARLKFENGTHRVQRMPPTVLGVPTKARPKCFGGLIFEMVLAECGSGAQDHEVASARIRKTIASLSPSEFANLTELREALTAEIVQGGAGNFKWVN